MATRDSFRHSEDRVVVLFQRPLGQFSYVMHTSPMRIERNGATERLPPRVERFLKECLGGVCQDDVQSPEQRRVDYVCRGGLLAVEIKTLEEDASERLGNLTDELRELEEWPMFYGAWPVESILKNFDDPVPIKLRLLNRLGRAIVTHLKKANKQLIAHASRFPRKNLVRAVILINEDHDVYSPEIVAHIAGHALRKREAGQLMLGDIDGILYFTERHATMINGQIAFPILHLQGQGVMAAPWKAEVISSALDRWSEFNQIDIHDTDDVRQFEAIEAVPDNMKRHEYWALCYRRQPYLRGHTQAQLRDLWDEVMVVSILNLTTGSPLRHDHNATMLAMEKQTHLQQEIAVRGLPLEAFAFDRARFVSAVSTSCGARQVRAAAPRTRIKKARPASSLLADWLAWKLPPNGGASTTTGSDDSWLSAMARCGGGSFACHNYSHPRELGRGPLRKGVKQRVSAPARIPVIPCSSG